MKAVIALFLTAFAFSAPIPQQTWTGVISDSNCKAEHAELMEGVPPLPAPECTKVCVTKAGWKYVLVVEDGEKIFGIENQNLAELATFGGKDVKVTGVLKGETITVSKIEAAAP